MVGNSARRHPRISNGLGQIVQPGQPVQCGVFSMYMQGCVSHVHTVSGIVESPLPYGSRTLPTERKVLSPLWRACVAETPTPKLPKSRLPKTDPTNRLSNGTDTAAPSTLGHATDGNKGQLLNQARQRQQQLNQSNTTETQKLSERANDRADADTSADKKQKAPIPKVPGSAASVMEKAGQNIADRHRQKRAEAGKEGDSAGMKDVKQVGKDMAAVAHGMAAGAAQGGLPGAVKEGSQKAVKTKTFWIKLAAILTPFFLLIGMVGGVIGMIVTSVSAGDTDTAQEATSRD